MFELTVREGSPGYIFATRREDGQHFEIYLQYGAIEPRITDDAQRALLLAACQAFQPPARAKRARDTSRDIPDVRTEMRRAGFDTE